jgi:DoxX-like family
MENVPWHRRIRQNSATLPVEFGQALQQWHSGGYMVRKMVYWTSTVVVAAMLLFALSYLTGNPQVVSGFTKAGYPQHLRIMLGIAKPVAAIVLLLPGLALLKEWAYAGAAFAWVMACVAHYSAGDGVQIWGIPLGLLVLLMVSYVTRPASRRLGALPASLQPS